MERRILTQHGVDNSLKGKITHMAGRVKDALGGLTGNHGLQAEGKVDQMKGSVQDEVGEVQRDLDPPVR